MHRSMPPNPNPNPNPNPKRTTRASSKTVDRTAQGSNTTTTTRRITRIRPGPIASTIATARQTPLRPIGGRLRCGARTRAIVIRVMGREPPWCPDVNYRSGKIALSR
ncbi:hypothetical protein AG1IA_00875 [Rhizoctonia solani AG-1 IA]|uniref:Uncharacterized protein n=1 Tax=Thanatephorus cucumeris (strain AG1-IA) TaxID=983506 RepID=L8X7L8_THACA|nr:hypothetical protein AG1IA_00875 [Rhizoctonia solani AG-1 IA]